VGGYGSVLTNLGLWPRGRGLGVQFPSAKTPPFAGGNPGPSIPMDTDPTTTNLDTSGTGIGQSSSVPPSLGRTPASTTGYEQTLANPPQMRGGLRGVLGTLTGIAGDVAGSPTISQLGNRIGYKANPNDPNPNAPKTPEQYSAVLQRMSVMSQIDQQRQQQQYMDILRGKQEQDRQAGIAQRAQNQQNLEADRQERRDQASQARTDAEQQTAQKLYGATQALPNTQLGTAIAPTPTPSTLPSQLPQPSGSAIPAQKIGSSLPPQFDPGTGAKTPVSGTLSVPSWQGQVVPATSPYTGQKENRILYTPAGQEFMKKQAEVAATPEKPVTPAEAPIGDSAAAQVNSANEARYQVNHPGQKLPDNYKVTADSKKTDVDRLDRLFGGTESAEATKAARDTATANAQAATAARDQKTDAALRAQVSKTYAPAMDSAERFNVMAKNAEDGKKGDQQAQLSLLANHLGMTMGLNKGARINQAIIDEAIKSRPWLQGLQAKFDSNGYLSGVTLTPQQMDQMVNLGRERYSEDIRKSRSEGKYLGATDDGPDRTLNDAGKKYYLRQTGGDVNRAKALAAADGWSM
jgi:hypothetical protein